MFFLNHSFPDPESNLALDEALLDSAEQGQSGEVLRIWESSIYFVVLGYSSKWKNEVLAQSCQQDSISILRRKSGGATILQGPGCLNFGLILKAHRSSGITSDTKKIMRRHQLAAQDWGLRGKIEVQGISDLTWKDKKFSGNAMRRGKKFFLFHGTFLYQFDIKAISKYLGSPDRKPDYRAHRNHANFLTNIPIKKETIISSLKQSWKANDVLSQMPTYEKIKLDTYSKPEWNFKY